MKVSNLSLTSITVLLSLLSASTVTAERLSDAAYKQEIQRFSKANPVQDMRNNVLNGKFLFFAFYDRGGRHIPGFSQEDHKHVSDNCQPVTMDSVGDVIFSDLHREYHKAYMDYAVKYNRQVVRLCTCKAKGADSNGTLRLNRLILPTK